MPKRITGLKKARGTRSQEDMAAMIAQATGDPGFTRSAYSYAENNHVLLTPEGYEAVYKSTGRYPSSFMKKEQYDIAAKERELKKASGDWREDHQGLWYFGGWLNDEYRDKVEYLMDHNPTGKVLDKKKLVLLMIDEMYNEDTVRKMRAV